MASNSSAIVSNWNHTPLAWSAGMRCSGARETSDLRPVRMAAISGARALAT
ncbi:hypothetical protein [Mesorhizobium sp. M1D.F.Ca.ET.043.01.1.1]|uniref:hypothetical protein n=1 Tax=Mesorhizobium sp. M1D.F.Ca.ET.043.01.1.1 TaxID=2493669 RepID=UPI001FDF61DA|nr:hypothetical protein [Mesorhizobium sp. M1D.F.Ca.ET.043.01.1.1]